MTPNCPLRVAMFTGAFPVVSETFILRQVTGLLDLGQNVDVYADCRPDPGTPVQSEIAQYRLIDRTIYMDMPPETAPWEMPVRPLTGRTWPPGSPTSVHNWLRVVRALPKFFRCLARAPRLACQVLKTSEYGYQAASLSALHRLARLCSQPKGYDVLHTHFGPVGNSFRFAKALWNAPLVVSFHGYDFCTIPRKQGTGVYAKLFQAADVVTVNSEFTRRQVAKLGCPEAKLRKLPAGLDLEQFAFRERVLQREPVRLLSVGRLVEIKGHEFAIRAVTKLHQQHANIRFDIVGDGPLRPQLEKLVAQLGLQEIVTLHGALANADVQQLMAKAHLFLLTSVNVEGDQEGQGLALQEAQACGLPVVATEHGALPEGILPGRSGLLTPERDIDRLAGQLDYLIGHPEKWPEMGRQGRAFVEGRYNIRRLNEELVSIYADAIESQRKP